MVNMEHEHPYNWRFNDERYNLLPPADFALLSPLSTEEARAIWQDIFKDGLATVVWINAKSGWQCTRTNRVDTDLYDTGAQVLDGYAIADQEVIFFWTRAVAVRTRWSIFRKYWDDFCYPSSDDVSIWPLSE